MANKTSHLKFWCMRQAHVPSFLSFLFFLSFIFFRGPPCGRQHVKYSSEDKGNYLLEREQWSSFAPTPKSDSECCNCLPLTLTVILLRSAVTEYFSVAFQKLSFSLSRRNGDASNVIESLGLTYFFSTLTSLLHRRKGRASEKTTRKAADRLV